jgi:hypothetical protein
MSAAGNTLTQGMDWYVKAKARFEDRLAESLAGSVDGWHRLIVKIEGGVITVARLELAEDVQHGVDTMSERG